MRTGYNYGQANPTTYVAPVVQTTIYTTYYQPTTTYYQPAPVVVYISTPGIIYNGYCSTLYATGPGLPTTRPGQCGTILVLNDAPRARAGWGGIAKWAGLVILVHSAVYAVILRRWLWI